MVRTSSSKAANTLAEALCPWGRFQKQSLKAPGGAKVRRSADQLTCEVANQGQKRPISTAMRKTEPKRGQAEEGSADRTPVETARDRLFGFGGKYGGRRVN
ncbi:uncharacterized protein N7496_010737 [Penicillium cataractarum]|uniref:Uncharacterized protein n=1 Tax=Penicillium cataractarum TaxID=2100454 RepID=A0A9W9RG71_9EURO|nr:uncharacterized protein N7496_010737 [Penicillium cataractarum]KAJ5358324.1 hypothetical protein N7496_010737 [Penicillium cataractarum]